jgi:hypothetical protein
VSIFDVGDVADVRQALGNRGAAWQFRREIIHAIDSGNFDEVSVTIMSAPQVLERQNKAGACKRVAIEETKRLRGCDAEAGEVPWGPEVYTAASWPWSTSTKTLLSLASRMRYLQQKTVSSRSKKREENTAGLQ